jgi:hypothetical protein
MMKDHSTEAAMASRINTDRIVTLNMGVGRDSIAMLCLLAEGNLQAVVDGTMRTITPADVDAVVFSDTGAEWDHTYQLIPTVRAMCEELGVPFVVLDKPSDSDFNTWCAAKCSDPKAKQAWVAKWDAVDMSCDGFGCVEAKAAAGGYHLRGKFMDDFERISTIASRGGACTCNHKLNCIRRFISDLALQRFGVADNRAWARAVRAGERRPHLSMVGFAADEANRYAKHDDQAYHGTLLPLVDMGIDKAGEAPILERHGLGHVRKSGCVCCPMQPMGGFWALRQLRPDLWEQVVRYEGKALARNSKMYISSSKGIEQAVEDWAAKHAGMATTDSVLDKRYDATTCTTCATIADGDALRSERRRAAEAKRHGKATAATVEASNVAASEPQGDARLVLRGGRYTTTATVEAGKVVGGAVYSQKLDGTCRAVRASSWSMEAGQLVVGHAGKGLPAVVVEELAGVAAGLAR